MSREPVSGVVAPLPAAASAELALLRAECAHLRQELEQRTAELEASRYRFRDVIERNADAIIVVDREGVIRFGNATAGELLRTGQEALPGTPFGFPLVAGETTELDLPRGGAVQVLEMRVVESEWEGQQAYIATLRDITERKQAEADARRLIREQAGRLVAEESARRFQFLAEASALLSIPLDYQEALATLGRLCCGEIADWAVVFVVDDAGAVQRLEVAHRDVQRAEAARSLREHAIDRSGGHPVLEVVRTRAPVLVTKVGEEQLAALAQDAAHGELMRQLGIASYMIVPLVARDRVLGAIGLVSADPENPFTAEHLAVANDLALRAALALDNVRLYRAAQDANKAKSDLLAVISHDLRTPINSILGHADLLALGLQGELSDGGTQWVERIRTAAHHVTYLINELLSFSRLEAGRDEPRLQDVDAGAVVAEVAAVIEPLARERGLTLRVRGPARPLPIRTDPDRLRQVLLNLAGNAVKYTQHGEVRLELVELAEELRFHVRDTGIGIRAEHLEKIFAPFWQVEPDQRGGAGGIGLGLGVVRTLSRTLGGEVTVASTPGHGSTFTLRLPRRAPG